MGLRSPEIAAYCRPMSDGICSYDHLSILRGDRAEVRSAVAPADGSPRTPDSGRYRLVPHELTVKLALVTISNWVPFGCVRALPACATRTSYSPKAGNCPVTSIRLAIWIIPSDPSEVTAGHQEHRRRKPATCSIAGADRTRTPTHPADKPRSPLLRTAPAAGESTFGMLSPPPIEIRAETLTTITRVQMSPGGPFNGCIDMGTIQPRLDAEVPQNGQALAGPRPAAWWIVLWVIH